MMLRGPQYVEAEFVHGPRHLARGEERLAQPLVRIAPVIRRRAVEPDVVELNLPDIQHVKLADHVSTLDVFVAGSACFKMRRMATSAALLLPFRISCPNSRPIR